MKEEKGIRARVKEPIEKAPTGDLTCGLPTVSVTISIKVKLDAVTFEMRFRLVYCIPEAAQFFVAHQSLAPSAFTSTRSRCC